MNIKQYVFICLVAALGYSECIQARFQGSDDNDDAYSQGRNENFPTAKKRVSKGLFTAPEQQYDEDYTENQQQTAKPGSVLRNVGKSLKGTTEKALSESFEEAGERLKEDIKDQLRLKNIISGVKGVASATGSALSSAYKHLTANASVLRKMPIIALDKDLNDMYQEDNERSDLSQETSVMKFLQGLQQKSFNAADILIVAAPNPDTNFKLYAVKLLQIDPTAANIIPLNLAKVGAQQRVCTANMKSLSLKETLEKSYAQWIGDKAKAAATKKTTSEFMAQIKSISGYAFDRFNTNIQAYIIKLFPSFTKGKATSTNLENITGAEAEEINPTLLNKSALATLTSEALEILLPKLSPAQIKDLKPIAIEGINIDAFQTLISEMSTEQLEALHYASSRWWGGSRGTGWSSWLPTFSRTSHKKAVDDAYNQATSAGVGAKLKHRIWG